MKQRLLRYLGVSFLMVQMVFLSGCGLFLLGAGAGAGSVAYYQGALRINEEASIDRVWQATRTAVQQLEFKVKEEDKDAVEAELRAETAQDRSIKIYLNRESTNETKITIRVGTFGDEKLSRTIYEQIKRNL